MITIPGDKIAYCDVDDTLVYWESTPEDKIANGVAFKCPGSLRWCATTSSMVRDNQSIELLVPNDAQIEQLKRLKLRHHTIIVWSAGGVDWAETVIKTLGLEDYVDAVMCKPTYVFDDLPVEEFMPKSRLIKKDSK